MFGLEWLVLIFGSFLGNLHAAKSGCPVVGERPGYDSYSQLSIGLCFQNEKNQSRHLEVFSPDRSVMLEVDGQDARFIASGHNVGRPLMIFPDEQVIWSPDSRALIFTSSLGAAGPVITGIGFVRGEPEVPDVTVLIQRDFAAGHGDDPCRKDANVGGLAWARDSGEAVVVAEVPPSPQCEETGGYFGAYVISVPEGKILRRYSMKDTMTRWRRILGPRLRDDIELLKDR
jgi:hypothetical protein